jgi:UDP-N-acetyl-D-mannosaminuronic acid transferase (WecB/TagA/CpsF family)
METLSRDRRYAAALSAADVRFVDSGFMTLSWLLLSGERLHRISGLRFLKTFLGSRRFHSSRSLWVHPSPEAEARNKKFLCEEVGLPEASATHCVAPIYPTEGAISDVVLLSKCQTQKPDVIVINLGSNIQEPLGAYLRNHLDYSPLILCTGGAIDLITGAQVRIPDWADRAFAGWLFRLLGTRQRKQLRCGFSSRMLRSWRLFGSLAKYRRLGPVYSEPVWD